MTDYLSPAVRLYLEKMVDWSALGALRGVEYDASADVGAYLTVLETAAALASSFEDEARANWSAEPQLTEDGGALMPPHMRAAYAKLQESGLVALTVSEDYGGAGLPGLINLIFLELLSRGDTSLMISVGLQTGAATDIEKYGSEEIKREYLPRFTSGEVMGCMDLTEPQAGSDLGGITTRATEQEDGSLRVDGQKIFISNGGAEIHLVLARDADSFEESKGTTNGLSLVLVSRHLPSGERNGIRVARLEEKLGIHGSPTCEVVFEDAWGLRLGEKGQGFRAMLDLMNGARLGVAAQGLGLAEGAFSDALDYARERSQFGQPIIELPLVKTMLARMAVDIEGARALLYRTGALVDRNFAREAALGRSDLPDAERKKIQADFERDTTRVRLLTPLCKYACTEMCDTVTRDAMQVFGGLGFTMDADVAKMHTDSLILTVYEGTSEIQASFALREMGKGSLGVVFKELRSELGEMAEDPERKDLASRVEGAIARIEDASRALFTDIQYAMLRAKLMAEMVIDVISATELLRQAGHEPARLDLAEAFIIRNMIEDEAMSRRIEQNAAGRLDRDERILSAS